MYKKYQKNKDFIMPFGKFKGKTIIQIVAEDRKYAEWARDKLSSRNIAQRFAEELGDGKAIPEKEIITTPDDLSQAPF